MPIRRTNTPRAPSGDTAVDATRIDDARTALLAFFDAHRRDLPWRRTADPFAIWVSEVMLQQTRVETVIPYYQRFLARFPTVRALADARLDDVLTAWSGLGYYRRARMLHAGARAVTDLHDGRVPDAREALESLPGVGAYTAGAIASIAFGRREAIVDGNVERVVSRLFALAGNPRDAAGKRRVWDIARVFADADRPGDVNQALMELGATVCVPVGPKCGECPWRTQCAAHAQDEAERFPELPARKVVREERWTAWVLVDDARRARHVWLEANAAGRWEGMLLPRMTLVSATAKARAPKAPANARDATRCAPVRHVLTHAAMTIDVYRAVAKGFDANEPRWVPVRDLDRRAVPKVTRVILAAAGIAAQPAR